MRGQGQHGLALERRIDGMLLIKADKQQGDRTVFSQRTPSSPDLDFNRDGPLFPMFINVFKNSGRVIAIRCFPWPAQRLEVDWNRQVQKIVIVEQECVRTRVAGAKAQAKAEAYQQTGGGAPEGRSGIRAVAQVENCAFTSIRRWWSNGSV